LAMDFCQSLVQLNDKFLDVNVNQLEVIFVSDGIAEDIPHLQDACRRFDFAKYIAFTRNFGQHIAISCGLIHSTGDLACYMDVDMEDPPSELPNLIRNLEESNSQICAGLRIGKGVLCHTAYFPTVSRPAYQVDRTLGPCERHHHEGHDPQLSQCLC
jgi:glycosyltransferase involved in cell wall biosynthesis